MWVFLNGKSHNYPGLKCNLLVRFVVPSYLNSTSYFIVRFTFCSLVANYSIYQSVNEKISGTLKKESDNLKSLVVVAWCW